MKSKLFNEDVAFEVVECEGVKEKIVKFSSLAEYLNGNKKDDIEIKFNVLNDNIMEPCISCMVSSTKGIRTPIQVVASLPQKEQNDLDKKDPIAALCRKTMSRAGLIFIDLDEKVYTNAEINAFPKAKAPEYKKEVEIEKYVPKNAKPEEEIVEEEEYIEDCFEDVYDGEFEEVPEVIDEPAPENNMACRHEDEVIKIFAKYKGQTLKQIAETGDTNYLKFFLSKTFVNNETKTKISEFLEDWNKKGE